MFKGFRIRDLSKLTIGRKLGLGFGIAHVLLLGVSIYAIAGLFRANAIIRDLNEQAAFGDAVDGFELNMYRARTTLADYVLEGEGGSQEQIAQNIATTVDACSVCHEDEGYSGAAPHDSPQVASLVSSVNEIRDSLTQQMQASLALYAQQPGDVTSINASLSDLDQFMAGEAGQTLDELNAVVDAKSAALAASATQQTRTMTIIISILGVLATGLAFGMGAFITRNITRQVNAISDTYSEIGLGNFDARADVTSEDELGEMALSLNAMLDNTLGLIQTRDERDAIQGSIQRLLNEVRGVAEGDLTAEAEVTADMTGSIADAFNMMIGYLRDIITGVQNATLQVSSSANEIQTTTEHLSQGSEAQADQIIQASAAIEQMASSISQVSRDATVSASVGGESLSNARQGATAVRNTITGMHRIRDQVQETAKRIKRLGEGSQEIGEIVQLIGDIADRTSILALNASIQAAMAGEAGQGFAVVAEEVERLAERSTEATKQIETLIRTIQTETTEAVAAMEATTNEVVEGSRLAEEAGDALREIESVSERLAELNQSISLASSQQASGSETLAASMQEIAEVTQQTAAGTKQAAVSISRLAELADGLRASVSTFKLPNGNGHK
jgi:twitching motility protein PilJ